MTIHHIRNSAANTAVVVTTEHIDRASSAMRRGSQRICAEFATEWMASISLEGVIAAATLVATVEHVVCSSDDLFQLIEDLVREGGMLQAEQPRMTHARARHGKSYTVRALVRDKEMFSEHFDSQEAINAAAVVRNGLRKLNAATGPGHAALDVLTLGIPKKHLQGWAKKILEQAN